MTVLLHSLYVKHARTDAGTALMALDACSAVSLSVDANEPQTDLHVHNKRKLCISIWSYLFEN